MKTIVSRTAFALSTVAFLSLGAAAHAKVERTGEPTVTFTAVGPGGLKIVGTTHELNVAENPTNVSVSVPLSNLKTGIDLRDKHMTEKYLQTAQFPTADLQVAKSALKAIASDGQMSGTAEGTISLHGKSKTLPFQYTYVRKGQSYEVSGTLHLNMKEFGIEVPSYLGVTVKPEVDVNVKFSANHLATS